MEAEDVILDDSCQRDIVEERSEVLPHIGIAVFPQTLIVESIYLSDLLALVVSS